jgi:membrane-associated phospholipid phosphatase
VSVATTPIPQPYAISAAFTNDVLSRTLVVRLPETEVGYGRLLWREAYAAYAADEESGWGRGPVYASALGAGRLAYAVPGDLQTLRFHFPSGAPAYAQLIAKPVSAIVTIDRGTSRFRTVRFLNRP